MMLLLFSVTLLLALMFLCGALAFELYLLVGDMAVALVAVGVVLLVVAVVIYILSVRYDFERWRRRLDTVYEVSATIDMVATQATAFLKKILG